MTESSTSPIDMFKNIYSTIFLIFSIAVLMGLIFEGKTRLADEFSPWLAFIVLWVAVIWLTMIEGGQASKVGLIPVDLNLYKESHPLAHKSMEIVAKGDNLDRYLMGRQFMVVLIVFCVNISGGPTNQEIWGLPDWLKWLMFVFPFGVMTLFTCMIGQLNSQVNAAHCMLDYINNYFALFTLYVAMFIEWTGLLHASYLVAMLVAAISGKPIKSNEPEKSGMTLVFFWLRGLYSTAILGFSLAVVIESLFKGRTTMYAGVPEAVTVVLFFVLMSVVGMLEGMQIAFFAVTKIPVAERGAGKFAKMTCELLFRGEGRNLPGFMIGRQICVVSCMIIVAKVTTVTPTPVGGENVLNVSDGLQKFLEFGFQGALVTTILGSISWQLVASAFPIEFLTVPVTYVLLQICLWLEATGLCSGAWVLAGIHAKIANFQHDEVYIGTAEERAGKSMGDHDDMNTGVGHIAKLPGFIEGAPETLKTLVKKDPTVLHYMESIRQMQLDENAAEP
jgi:hypothetical protein